MEENFAPYAPAGATTDTIKRYRDRGLPTPLTPQALETIGVAETMAPRTLQALRFLGLLDDDDNPTDLFERLRLATTEEYPAQLAEVIRGAYIRVFAIVDPATDGDIAVADAFRAFQPAKQRVKMISLFRGLCAEAGITEKTRQQSTTRRSRADTGKPKPRVRPGGSPPPAGKPDAGSGTSRTGALSEQEMRSQYFMLLLKGAAEGTTFDPDVLDRMERLVNAADAVVKTSNGGRKPAAPTAPASTGPADQGED